jgi:glycosyltransferase involved in cell wall biosynthesis
MYVRNDLTAEARVLKEARSLVSAGHAVTVIGTLPPEAAARVDRAEVDGVERIRVRLPRWRRWWRWVRAPSRAWARLRGRPTRMDSLDWLAMWRFGNLGWARAAAAVAPRADVHHGHDLTGLPAAARAARRDGARLVYDSHELYLESGAVTDRSRLAVDWLARLERRIAAGADALVTVNAALAERLGPRLGVPRVVVVHNCPPRPTEADPSAGGRRGDDRIRRATGLDGDAPLVVYHGGFRPARGLDQLLEAFARPELADAHLGLLGFGPLRDRLLRAAADPAVGGRIHVLDPVPPDEVVAWVASADVAAMPIQPRPLSYHLSTPNKLFEALAAGVPVVGPDAPGFRSVVLADPEQPLGALCDPTDPASIAAAIRSILDLPADARAALRDRCRRAAVGRWNWETEVAGLVALYADLGAADPR